MLIAQGARRSRGRKESPKTSSCLLFSLAVLGATRVPSPSYGTSSLRNFFGTKKTFLNVKEGFFSQVLRACASIYFRGMYSEEKFIWHRGEIVS